MAGSQFNTDNLPSDGAAPVGVCATVQVLSDVLRRARSPIEPAQALLLSILWQMPLYRDIKALDLWEAAFNDAFSRAREHAPNVAALDLVNGVFEFGRFNLYGAFDAAGTAREFGTLRNRLATAGVRCSIEPALSDW